MVDFTKTAFIFPGQGSQAVGMGKDIADNYPIANETIEQANDIMGIDLAKLMFEGSEESLSDTAITQPAMYVVGMAVYRALKQELPDAIPAFVAGHSLGELTALTVAGALSYEDGLKLVQTRGQLMKDAGEQHPGGMVVILSLDASAVEDIVTQASEQSGAIVVIANDNCPGQIVISGEHRALDIAVELAKEAGARRAIPLNVSVATHSPLMQPAKDAFSEALNVAGFNDASIPVVQNVCACEVSSASVIRANLEAQLVSSVRWTESIQTMIEADVETFVEIGSKSVLTGLLRRINRAKTGVTIQDTSTLQAFVASNS